MLLAMSIRTPLARNEAVAVVGRPVLATTSASSFAWHAAAAACSSGINSLPHALPSAKYQLHASCRLPDHGARVQPESHGRICQRHGRQPPASQQSDLLVAEMHQRLRQLEQLAT